MPPSLIEVDECSLLDLTQRCTARYPHCKDANDIELVEVEIDWSRIHCNFCNCHFRNFTNVVKRERMISISSDRHTRSGTRVFAFYDKTQLDEFTASFVNSDVSRAWRKMNHSNSTHALMSTFHSWSLSWSLSCQSTEVSHVQCGWRMIKELFKWQRLSSKRKNIIDTLSINKRVVLQFCVFQKSLFLSNNNNKYGRRDTWRSDRSRK